MITAGDVARRTLLSTVGAGVAAIAGCQSDGGSNEVALARIELVNFDDQPVIFDLEVQRNSETMYDERHRIGPSSGQKANGTTVDEQWMRTSSQYEVSVTVDSQSKTITASRLLTMFDSDRTLSNPCGELRFQVSPARVLESYGSIADGCDEVD